MSCTEEIDQAYLSASNALEKLEKLAQEWVDPRLEVRKVTHAVSRHLNEARYHLHNARRKTRPDYQVSEDEL